MCVGKVVSNNCHCSVCTELKVRKQIVPRNADGRVCLLLHERIDFCHVQAMRL